MRDYKVNLGGTWYYVTARSEGQALRYALALSGHGADAHEIEYAVVEPVSERAKLKALFA